MSKSFEEKVSAIYQALPDAEISPLFGYFQDIEQLARAGQKDFKNLPAYLRSLARNVNYISRDLNEFAARFE